MFDADSGPAMHQHISQTYKLLSENTFIITFEMPGKLPLELAFLPRSSLIIITITITVTMTNSRRMDRDLLITFCA